MPNNPPSISIFYMVFSKYKKVFLITGLLFFVVGILIDVFAPEPHSIWLVALSHFLLIFGEALSVFFMINVVLENETREKFMNDTKELISDQQAQILRSFDEISRELLAKTGNLFTDINRDIFRVILQERTSPEIAVEINQDDFFKSSFLRTKTDMKFWFSVNTGRQNQIDLRQEDDFAIKNISKEEVLYHMRLFLTATSSKTYDLVEAGFSTDGQGKNFCNLSKENFHIETIEGLKAGTMCRLKEPVITKPQDTLRIYRTLQTCFVENTDGIDDFWFTTQYVMPFTFKVEIPAGYEFSLFPTFPQERLKGPYKIRNEICYDIPFLFPGQAFSYTLVKISGN